MATIVVKSPPEVQGAMLLSNETLELKQQNQLTINADELTLLDDNTTQTANLYKNLDMQSSPGINSRHCLQNPPMII